MKLEGDQYNEPEVNSRINSTIKSQGYFIVGVTKFVLMDLCTFGIYERYWMYKNWKYIKAREQSDIMPFWRTVFAPLWLFSLGSKIQKDCNEFSVESEFDYIIIGIFYLILSNLWRLPDPYWLICFLSFFPLLSLQSAAFKVNQLRGVTNKKNVRFNAWNYIFLGFGSFLFILIVIGFLIPPQ